MIAPMPLPSQPEYFRPSQPGRANHPLLPLASFSLIGISLLVAALSRLGQKRDVLEHLFITNTFATGADVRLPEIASGEAWRLVTPIFIHLGLMHLVFNLLWLRDLGAMIERIDGVARLLVFVLVSGVLSNLGQLYTNGPYFGGMSGVVYGLLGYVWMQSRFNPRAGFVLPTQTVLLMLGWFVACVAGVIPHVANTAHGVGLGIGIIWGFAAAKMQRSGFRSSSGFEA
jgi:membrane associated rhomboid family serine protease